mmetsp:Transcript_38661/g.95625  ORF Transcript_38661/g.95625 Transcript_38661/m.95625 type:complete len:250 (-) Transcript_38661:750-1499(-)
MQVPIGLGRRSSDVVEEFFSVYRAEARAVSERDLHQRADQLWVVPRCEVQDVPGDLVVDGLCIPHLFSVVLTEPLVHTWPVREERHWHHLHLRDRAQAGPVGGLAHDAGEEVEVRRPFRSGVVVHLSDGVPGSKVERLGERRRVLERMRDLVHAVHLAVHPILADRMRIVRHDALHEAAALVDDVIVDDYPHELYGHLPDRSAQIQPNRLLVRAAHPRPVLLVPVPVLWENVDADLLHHGLEQVRHGLE